MKKSIILSLITLLFVAITANAQFGRNDLRDKASRLVSTSSDLASRLSDDLRRGYSNSRSDIEAAFIASQIESSARLFEQMVQNNRRDSELRDASSFISDLIRRAPSYGSNSYYWNDVKRAYDDIQRSVGGYGGGNNDNNGGWGNNDNRDDDYSRRIGSVTWKGKVDKEVHLRIRNNTLEYSLFDGIDYGAGTYNFVSSMPTNNKINLYVKKKKGRGSVTIIQQPDRFNNYTAVIKILDDDGGAKDYEVEVYWTR
ncbi:MAG: hypothetical protein K1X72_16695 [Pyrinomonadaceae bacterium]|nr:hypothetical protein [Pyrinomonadaceae bacterium]